MAEGKKNVKKKVVRSLPHSTQLPTAHSFTRNSLSFFFGVGGCGVWGLRLALKAMAIALSAQSLWTVGYYIKLAKERKKEKINNEEEQLLLAKVSALVEETWHHVTWKSGGDPEASAWHVRSHVPINRMDGL
ncbi:Uncharacterized protein TCM_005614 [Theobroma cacao]|uniref:Uncharacterized protein n=1 Tax=Theobroma cacao TaxID=3641 RepID=A0A061DUD6_THECC|nr:Uncharacterized protein TCM_005614 [Theobroma cacao]